MEEERKAGKGWPCDFVEGSEEGACRQEAVCMGSSKLQGLGGVSYGRTFSM